MGDWTLFSNYGHVLVCLAGNSRIRLREVAAEVGITERAVQKIVRDLQEAGYVSVSKQGRCNRYRINRRKSLRHPLESHCNVGRLLSLIAAGAPATDATMAEVDAAEDKVPQARTAPPQAKTAPPQAERAPPQVESQPKPAESAPEPPTVAAEEKKPATPKRKDASEERSGPIDTRQQGSLF